MPTASISSLLQSTEVHLLTWRTDLNVSALTGSEYLPTYLGTNLATYMNGRKRQTAMEATGWAIKGTYSAVVNAHKPKSHSLYTNLCSPRWWRSYQLTQLVLVPCMHAPTYGRHPHVPSTYLPTSYVAESLSRYKHWLYSEHYGENSRFTLLFTYATSLSKGH